MKIGIVVFAYNRSRHLYQTLEALKRNKEVNKIYIFQDGLKKEEHRREWERTKEVILEVDWCEVTYVLSDVNKGLKKSILDGVNYVFRENDAVVVLEDDCVTNVNFMSFMRQCLVRYEEDKQVFSVSGYAWPVQVQDNNLDAYFCGRISSWGWGTWKDRWDKLEIDYEVTKEMKLDRDISERLALWGNDMEDILIKNVKGETDSWAVFWGLTVIKHGGVCLNPYCSLVTNIGFDGSGTHCGNGKLEVADMQDNQKEVFDLPTDLSISEEMKCKFQEIFCGGVYFTNKDKHGPTVVIYGMGNFYKKYEKRIANLFHVVGFIDKNKIGYYAGREIGKVNELEGMSYDVIIIMLANLGEAMKVMRELHAEYGIPLAKIRLGVEVFEKDNYHICEIKEEGELLLKFNHDTLLVGSYDEYENAKEVLGENVYHFVLNNDKKDIVIDIGASIGDSALYFLNRQKVEKVYLYEPFEDTFLTAKKNLKDYIGTERLEMNMYGISNVTEKRKISFNPNMSCGQSTIHDVREKAKKIYQGMNLVDESDERVKVVEVRRASEVLAPLLRLHADKNVVLKMDCEGEEYCIFEDLFEEGLIQAFKIIILEWHYNGKDKLVEILDKTGFSYYCRDKDCNMGMIYAYR